MKSLKRKVGNLLNFGQKSRYVLNIKAKLLLSFFVLLFVPLYIITDVAVNKITQSNQKSMIASSKKSMEQSTSFLNYKLQYVINNMEYILYGDDLQNLLSQNPQKYDKDVAAQAKDQARISNNMLGLINNDDIFNIRIYIRHIPYFSYNQTGFYKFSDIKSATWYFKLRFSENNLKWFGTDYFESEYEKNKMLIVSVAKLIYNPMFFKEIVGVIRIDMLRSTIENILSKCNMSQSGIVYITNEFGEVISYSGNNTLLKDFNIRKIIENGDNLEDTENTLVYSKEQFLIISSLVENTDWRIYSVIPYSDITSVGKSLKKYMLILMAILACFSYIIAYYISSSIAKRLRKLKLCMKKVESGDLNTRITINSRDEIGNIAVSFNNMAKEMAVMSEQRFCDGKKMKSLELKALQAQINPHFLYNTLDMLNWEAMINGNKEIVTIVQALSRFFKIGLSKGNEMICLKNEIEHVKAYVLIQNLRFLDAINLEVNIPDELYNNKIVKILLQPLVENSILHGIMKKPEKTGTIKITAKQIDEILFITVEDDGIGIKDSELAVKEYDDKQHGYGIVNISQRIKLHYGDKYGITFESSPGVGTKVTLEIPAI